MGQYMLYIQNDSTSAWAHISYIYKMTIQHMGPYIMHIQNYSTSAWAHIHYIYKITVLAHGPIYTIYTK